MSAIKKKLDYLLKHNVSFGKIFRFFANGFFRFLGFFFPVKEKTVLFTAHGRGYNDSPREIYERMLSDDRFSDYSFYWGLDDTNIDIPGNAIKIKADTWAYFKTAFRSKYWVACVNIERSFRFKKKKQKYLNTDHGIPIKKFGNQVAGRKDFNFYHINYFCVSGEFEAEMYPNAYHLNPKNIIRTGLPRNDSLYNYSKEEVSKIKKRLNLGNKKIVLYAPTWRDSTDSGNTFVLKPPISFKKWESLLKKDYIILLRTHPYTTELLGVEFDEFVRDYSNYKNVNDLIKVADILISDYSAILFDFAITEKPMFCFAYDYDEYHKERGLVLDLANEFPGGIVRTEDELLYKVLNMDCKVLSKQVADFKRRYIEYGGDATEKCINYLFGETK